MSVNGDGTVTLSFVPLPFSESTRPRFWFFSLARCNGGGFVNAAYHSHALQIGESDWNKEFSEDQNGLNTLYLSFFFLFTLLVVINCIGQSDATRSSAQIAQSLDGSRAANSLCFGCALLLLLLCVCFCCPRVVACAPGTYKLQQRLSYLHPMIKLFLIVLVLEYISVFVLLLHYGSFAQNGTGIVELLKAGQILSIASRCFFMLLLLFLAKGWTISTETLTRKGAVVGLVVCYLILDITILLWSMYDADPRRTTPGKTVLALSILVDVVWLGFSAWFAVEIFWFSYRPETNAAKRSLYLKLGLLFLPWLLLPVLVSFAVFALDPWVRIRIVSVFQVGITWLAYAVLAFLFWPSRAEEAFSISTPDVMSGGAGRSELDYQTL